MAPGITTLNDPFASTGGCNSAGAQVFPPSADTSTCLILPRPLQARPVIWYNPGPCFPFNTMPPEGEVINDFASMVNVNMRALPDGSSSVYLAVSFLAIMGPGQAGLVCFNTMPPEGEVINDFASMVNVNMRALPDGSSS